MVRYSRLASPDSPPATDRAKAKGGTRIADAIKNVTQQRRLRAYEEGLGKEPSCDARCSTQLRRNSCLGIV
jgi:hypothetical protein